MELVYLWVEDYKNIKKQGFNFSPRFKCEFKAEYDENDRLKDNCELIIKEKKHESIFPENTNLTAIVGSNGSGKSSVLKFIRLFLRNFTEIEKNNTRYDTLIPSKSLLLLYDKNLNKIVCFDYEVNSMKNKEIKYIPYSKNNLDGVIFFKNTIFPLLDYSLTYDRSVDSYTANKEKENQFLSFPDKSRRSLEFWDEEKKMMKKILQNYHELNQKKQWCIFEEFFHPEYIEINFSKHRFRGAIRKLLKDESISNLNNYLRVLKTNKKKITNEFNYLLFESLSSIEMDNRDSRMEILKELNDSYSSKIFDSLCNKNISEVKLSNNYRLDELMIFKFNISDITEDEVDYLLKLTSSEVFSIDVVDKNDKRFNSLSFGEQQLLKVLNIIYYLANLEDTKELLIFLDEVDIGFHPDWQKKVIKYILDLIKLLKEKNFHLLVSSHSPFIISDIPKQNIIFLNKDEKSNSQDMTENMEIKTFGANIHTLLSHGFFMKDGLMGEFAKGKIDEVIKYLNDESSTEIKTNDEAQCIINIIGEPIIKRELQRKLDSKRLSKIDKIDEIEKQMKIMEEQRLLLEYRLESIRKNQ